MGNVLHLIPVERSLFGFTKSKNVIEFEETVWGHYDDGFFDRMIHDLGRFEQLRAKSTDLRTLVYKETCDPKPVLGLLDDIISILRKKEEELPHSFYLWWEDKKTGSGGAVSKVIYRGKEYEVASDYDKRYLRRGKETIDLKDLKNAKLTFNRDGKLETVMLKKESLLDVYGGFLQSLKDFMYSAMTENCQIVAIYESEHFRPSKL